MVQKHYDLVIVGAGSGLNLAAKTAEANNWKVAVIEKGPLGGTCLNRGCIPSKILIHAADVANEIRRAREFGIDAEITGIRFADVVNRASEFVDADAAKLERGVRAHPGIDLYETEAYFVSDKTLDVGGPSSTSGQETITGERILIAAGTRPFVPPVQGIESIEYLTSDEALRLTKQPKSMIIIGGGYISAELGHFFGALGTEVTIIEAGERLIGREDSDISAAFTRIFSESHRVVLNAKVISVAQGNGLKQVIVEGKDGKQQTLEAEALLLTTGRRSASDLLKLKENTKIELDERGFVKVNEYLETNVPNVWALGDIVGKAPFKHGANMEARHLLAALTGGKKTPVDYSLMPHAIFSYPQVAGVGLTEEEAKAKGIKYEVRKKEYAKTGMGKALEEKDGFVKFIIDPEKEKILGCHIMGPHASTLIHEVIVAMKAGGDISLIRDSIHVHPALSEVVQRAL
ncbi:MAG: dihydrolipoyl dehydrogenase [Parcubacteria group bacterium]|nr:dihydrolipoyl dehydrogenase [Parcubacteria group bacterium]